MVFELATGDFLFYPKERTDGAVEGGDLGVYSKDEDHLAQVGVDGWVGGWVGWEPQASLCVDSECWRKYVCGCTGGSKICGGRGCNEEGRGDAPGE